MKSELDLEAYLDLGSFDHKGHSVGEIVGNCNAEIIDIEDEPGYLAKVHPEPKVCNACPLSDYCTESKAP